MNYFIPRRRPFQVVRLDLKDLLREMTGYFPFSFSRSLSGFSLVRYFALRSYPTPSGYGISLPFVGPLTDYDLFLFLTCKNFEPFRSFGRFRIIFIESFPTSYSLSVSFRLVLREVIRAICPLPPHLTSSTPSVSRRVKIQRDLPWWAHPQCRPLDLFRCRLSLPAFPCVSLFYIPRLNFSWILREFSSFGCSSLLESGFGIDGSIGFLH